MSICSLSSTKHGINSGQFVRSVIFILVSMLIFVFCLFGCAPEQKEGASNPSQASDEVQMAIQQLTEADPLQMNGEHVSINEMGHFNVDANVELPEKWNPVTYEVENMQFADVAKAKYKKILGKNAYLESEMDDEGLYRCYQNGNDDYLVGQSGSIGYMRNPDNQGVSVFTFQPSTTLKDPYKEIELEGLAKSEALRSAKDMLSEFNIGLPNGIMVFAATKEALNESAQTLAKDFDDDVLKANGEDPDYEYTTDDEFYVMFAPEILEGMPVATTNYEAGIENAYGTLIKVEVGRGGIRYLSVDNYLQIVAPIDQDGVSSETPPISLGQALQALNDKYKQVVTTDRISIDRIALEYVPTYDKSLASGEKVVPGWTFRDAGNPDVSYRVNAITGEMIV